MKNQKQPYGNLTKYILPTMAVIIVILLYRYRIGIVSSRSNFPWYGIKTVAVQHVPSVKDTSSLKWSPLMDVLDEEDLMKEQPLTDYRKGLNISKSKVILLGNSPVYQVGDEMRISITALDGYGNLRKRGGDQFRVRIFEEDLKAAASGYVIDHKNGTYTAVVKALWSGKPNISVVYGYPWELIRAWYDTFRKTCPNSKKLLMTMKSTSSYLANYQVTTKSGREKPQGLCHPILNQIKKISEDYCNRTMQNGGAALYCSKPEHANCNDFVGYEYNYTNIEKAFTTAEIGLSNRYGKVLKTLQVMVKEYPLAQKLPACTNYNVSSLWMMESPIGYFYRNSWNLVHCQGLSEKSFEKCLKNKHIILAGDSTIRQWFEYFVSAFNCKISTNRHMYKVCHNIDLNLIVEISFHSIPGHYFVNEPIIHSIPYFLETYNFSPKIIFVFHMQSHLSSYHPRVFKLRMLEIRKSIDIHIRKNKSVRFFVKGPHTFRPRKNKFCDYFGYVYRTIMLDVFKGLFETIVYLDSKDMTIATAQIDNHPTKDVVRGMVKQFLSYACADK